MIGSWTIKADTTEFKSKRPLDTSHCVKHWRQIPQNSNPKDLSIRRIVYAQVREEEQVISLQFIGSQQDVSKCRRKKRQQVDDGTAIA